MKDGPKTMQPRAGGSWNPPGLRRELKVSRDHLFAAAGITQNLFRPN